MQTHSKSEISKKKRFYVVTPTIELTSFSVDSKLDVWHAAIAMAHAWRIFALQNQDMSCGPGFLHPLNRNVVCCRWDYKIKCPPEGSNARVSPSSLLLDIICNKALWKLSVINAATVCIVLSLDIINGFLKEEMYKPQPRSFVGIAFLDHVCRLPKSNYGLKQAPQAWFDCCASHLKTLGFQVFNHLMLIPQCS